MTKLTPAGRIMFALGMTALGILCFFFNEFIVGRPPGWSSGGAPILGYSLGALTVLASVGVLINKKAGWCSLVIALLILCFSVFRHLPHFMDDWLNAYKAMALLGGAMIVACSSRDGQGSAPAFLTLSVARTLKWVSCALLAAFFIACGYAHFKFADFVKDFIPGYIPFHVFFTYFTAVCLIAGGIGLLVPPIRKWAALLSGIMVGSWFLLLHIPRFIANTSDPSDQLGLFESFMFAGIFFVLAGMEDEGR